MKQTRALQSRESTLPKSPNLINTGQYWLWEETWFEIHAGSVGGRHQTNAKVHDPSQSKNARWTLSALRATWCRRRRFFSPWERCVCFFRPLLIVVLRYALMSPEEIEDHVMSQMPRTEQEGACSLARIKHSILHLATTIPGLGP